MCLYTSYLKNWNFADAKVGRFKLSKKGHCGFTRTFFDNLKMPILAKAKTNSSSKRCVYLFPAVDDKQIQGVALWDYTQRFK